MPDPSTRAKWRALRSARVRTLEKQVDTADIVRDGDVTTTEIFSRPLHPVNAFEFNELNFGVGVTPRRSTL